MEIPARGGVSQERGSGARGREGVYGEGGGGIIFSERGPDTVKKRPLFDKTPSVPENRKAHRKGQISTDGPNREAAPVWDPFVHRPPRVNPQKST